MTAGRKTIFWVGDDLANLMAGKNAIGEEYNVFTTNSVDRLLKKLEKNIPDLILLDVEMAEMNGYDTLKTIKNKSETAQIPVILLRSKNDTDSELEGLSLGAADYINKPFTHAFLKKRIDLHLLVESQKQELKEFNDNLQSMVQRKTQMIIELQNTVMTTMAKLVEFRDDITGGHIERTQGYLSILIYGLQKKGIYKEEVSSWNIDLVLLSAQLHDVGKIAIKDSILQKPGKLTNEEFEEIKMHAVFGYKFIEKIKKNASVRDFLKYAKICAGTHHEKWDGSGYPQGLKGEEIPLLGRLMAIADVYDALVSERPYKQPLTHEEAVKIITGDSGTHFDPTLVDMFLEVSHEFNKVAVLYKSVPMTLYEDTLSMAENFPWRKKL